MVLLNASGLRELNLHSNMYHPVERLKVYTQQLFQHKCCRYVTGPTYTNMNGTLVGFHPETQNADSASAAQIEPERDRLRAYPSIFIYR